MNKSLEGLYYRSPVCMQNLAVSLMGWKLYKERYGAGADVYEKELMKSQNYSGEQLKELQSKRFVEIARSAINYAPHYQDWARSKGISAEDIYSLDDLQRFPVLTKEEVREAPERFVIGGEEEAKRLIKLHTSGTTGTPLTIYCSREDRTRHYAFFARLRARYGLKRRSKRATLFGRVIMLSDQSKPPFWRYDAVGRNLLMSSYHLSENNLYHYYQKLLSYKPEEIFAYPSSIAPIAQYITAHNLPKLKLKLVMTTAEPLYPYQREAIEQAFDAPVVNQYGCTEMAFFAYQKTSELMMLAPEHGISEVLTEDASIQSAGDGELIVTGLVNQKMPLIRYKVGDQVLLRAVDEQKSGEAAFSGLTSMSGRTGDFVVTRGGVKVYRLGSVFHGVNNLSEGQIVQNQDMSLTVKLKPFLTSVEIDTKLIEAELRKKLGVGAAISVIVVNSIDRERSGKFKLIVNKMVGN